MHAAHRWFTGRFPATSAFVSSMEGVSLDLRTSLKCSFHRPPILRSESPPPTQTSAPPNPPRGGRHFDRAFSMLLIVLFHGLAEHLPDSIFCLLDSSGAASFAYWYRSTAVEDPQANIDQYNSSSLMASLICSFQRWVWEWLLLNCDIDDKGRERCPLDVPSLPRNLRSSPGGGS